MNSDVFEISINLENKNSICSFNDVWYRMYENESENEWKRRVPNLDIQLLFCH